MGYVVDGSYFSINMEKAEPIKVICNPILGSDYLACKLGVQSKWIAAPVVNKNEICFLQLHTRWEEHLARIRFNIAKSFFGEYFCVSTANGNR